jgi:hypothetical protein
VQEQLGNVAHRKIEHCSLSRTYSPSQPKKQATQIATSGGISPKNGLYSSGFQKLNDTAPDMTIVDVLMNAVSKSVFT